MAILLARIDDRLIHGQVTTSWIRSNEIQVIIVVDDKIATDQVQLSVLKVAAPPGIKLYALSVDTFTKKFKEGILDKYRVMLIFSGPSAPVQLLKNGIKLESVNLGGMRFSPSRRQITKAVSVSQEESDLLKYLVENGVEVEHRQLQSDTKVDIVSML